jgi:hypothetical protein
MIGLLVALERNDILAASGEISHFNIRFGIPERYHTRIALIDGNLALRASLSFHRRPCLSCLRNR